MVLSRKKILVCSIVSFIVSLVGCGVKGPPEPPYPTEATVKKEPVGDGEVPFAMPTVTPTATPDSKATPTKSKNKTKKKKTSR
jgi:predicted small lipoprotein YifL